LLYRFLQPFRSFSRENFPNIPANRCLLFRSSSPLSQPNSDSSLRRERFPAALLAYSLTCDCSDLGDMTGYLCSDHSGAKPPFLSMRSHWPPWQDRKDLKLLGARISEVMSPIVLSYFFFCLYLFLSPGAVFPFCYMRSPPALFFSPSIGIHSSLHCDSEVFKRSPPSAAAVTKNRPPARLDTPSFLFRPPPLILFDIVCPNDYCVLLVRSSSTPFPCRVLPAFAATSPARFSRHSSTSVFPFSALPAFPQDPTGQTSRVLPLPFC